VVVVYCQWTMCCCCGCCGGYDQSHAARQKWEYKTLGLFKHSLHFVVSLPSADLLTEFLTTTLEKLLKQVPCTCRFCPSRCLLAVVLSVPSSGHRLWAFVWCNSAGWLARVVLP
jgi:hypothetical protein